MATRRSFSVAAQERVLSQPAISRLVQRLESELGVALVDRGVRPLALTAAGVEFLDYAQQALARWDDITERLQGGARQVRGRLTVAASTTPGEFVVPRLLNEFLNAFPQVQPSVVIVDSEAVIQQVLARQFDLGFIGAPRARSPLSLIKVGEDEIVLAVQAGHPFARRGSIELKELGGQRLILREDGSGTFRILRRRLSEQGLALPPHQVAMVLGSTGAIVSAVRDGIGMGFVSSLALADAPSDGVQAVRIEGLDLRRELYLAYHPARTTNPVAQEFVRFIRELMEQQPPTATEGSEIVKGAAAAPAQ